MAASAGARRIIRGDPPKAGWTFYGGLGRVSEQDLFLIAGGVTYSILLALFPGLASLVSLYGLVLDHPN